MRFAAGREIYRENATADCAYVIARGEVVLYRDHDGEAMLLARLGEGAILGELALIAQARRLSYAAAATDVEAIRLNRTLFRRILEEYPEVADQLRQRISADLQDLIAKIEGLASRFAG